MAAKKRAPPKQVPYQTALFSILGDGAQQLRCATHGSGQEPEITASEVAEIRENRRDVAVGNPKPARERRRILIARRRRNHLSTLQAIRSVERLVRKDAAARGRRAVQLLAGN